MGVQEQSLVPVVKGQQNRRNNNNSNNDKRRSKNNTKVGKTTMTKEMASISETMSFVFAYGWSSKILFLIGTTCAFLNGLVGPMLAVMFSVALGRAANVGIDIEDIAFDDIKQVSLGLVMVGLWAFSMTFVQTVCFEIVAFRGCHSMNLQWFRALLRQDAAFFDVYDVPGIASLIQPTCYLYRRGMGAKFAEGIQYLSTVVGGVGFAFVASWRISILVLAVLPFCIACSVYAIHLSQTRTARANKTYKRAGGVAYTTISSLRTILAFNAVPEMIDRYKDATEEAARISKRFLVKFGIVSGFFLSSYIVMFVAVSLYGAKLLYTDIEEFGCDPTAGLFSDMACETTGANILGAFLGFLFAAEGMTQVATFLEGIVEARVAAFEALRAIQRKAGTPREVVYHPHIDPKQPYHKKFMGLSDTESDSENEYHDETPNQPKGRTRLDTDDIEFVGTVGNSIDCCQILAGVCCNKAEKPIEQDDIEEGIPTQNLVHVKAILPRYEIDSSNEKGIKPDHINGKISFQRVCFSYPTRPMDRILHNFSLEIEAGQTVAFVGPSGSGKSTIVSMIERFYDPSSGIITIDGIDLRHLNVSHLRSMIGYVGQEPTLFNTTIQQNIAHGAPDADFEQLVAAARMANAHDFICDFPDGYDTHVGDKGSQLSGGQKQRIALARVLISSPSILLLDEATSALDSESELLVQTAIDNILSQRKLTTLIIAHRLSTIRNADVIAVVADGAIVETGTHDDLMRDSNSYYRKLVLKQERPKETKCDNIMQLDDSLECPRNAAKDGDAVPAKPITNRSFASRIASDVISMDLYDPGTVELMMASSSFETEGNNSRILSGVTIETQDPDHAELDSMPNCDRKCSDMMLRSQSSLVSPHDLPLAESFDRVSRLDAPPTVELRVSASKNLFQRNDYVEVVYYPKFSGSDIPHINFKNVSFAYPTRPCTQIFDGFNLSIRCGETVALVGPSGGGKSTTVAMIERYYEPSEGVLEYMGYDARCLHPHWYRDQIGIVSQEPNLLNDTIANNIAFGDRNASREMILEAAKQANAHDFIMGFPQGYETPVGNRGGQLSGGQKQRIAIARALVKKPKVLILDEATSALDSDSEAIVQAALDKLMVSRDHTTIVIAHRLSTIRNSDRIAVVAEGKVQEVGSHEELMMNRTGRYRRLVESQKRSSTLTSAGLQGDDQSVHSTSSSGSESTSSSRDLCSELDNLGTSYFSTKRVLREAARDTGFILIGSIGAIMNGAVFPSWGIMFAQTINLLFQRVLECPSDDEIAVEGFSTCQDYWTASAEQMKQKSHEVGIAWCILVVASLIGAVCSKVGFGTAAERLNKRIRDSTFTSLVRQEVAFFDKHSIGKIMSVLQDDTTKLYAFTGEPLRMFWIGLSSVAIGVLIAFAFVWPVALVALGCIPLMGYALSLRMGKAVGLDRGSAEGSEQDNPSNIIVETLLNIRTVAALTLEDAKFEEFKESLRHSDRGILCESSKTAVNHGMAYLLHHWVDSLLLFFAGWILHTYPDQFTFLEVLNSNFALYFSLFGLGVALKEVADREEIKIATSRVFYLLDRKTRMDPLSANGTKLD